MEESDQEMSEEIDSDNDVWSGIMPGPDERTEQCKVGKETLQLPELFLEKKHIFMSVLSMDTWDTVLTDEQKGRLEQLLPPFPNSDGEEKRETLRRLFSGENFKFGNPVEDLQRKLREGYLHPEIARYRKQTRLFRYRDYKMRQQRHLSDLLKHLLLTRQGLFEQASTLAPGEPIKFQYIPPPKKKASPLEQTVKKKTLRILKEVREECGVPDTSSEEEDETSSPVQRSRRQLFKSLGPIPSPEPTIPSVVSTFASKPSLVNGDLSSVNHIVGDSPVQNLNHKRPRPISPVEVTEESYKLMLKLHKKKKLLDPDLPELDTSSISLQDILTRCQANKKNVKINADTPTSSADNPAGNPAALKKRLKLKAKGEKKKKLKVKDLPTASVEDEDAIIPPLLSTSEMDQSSSFLGVDEETEEVSRTVFGPAANFFCLLRSILSEFPDGKYSTPKIEDRVREWLDLNDEISNPWLALQKSWVDHVVSALKFLSGSELGLKVENFIPLVDYKERAQQWKWIGIGRDSDPELSSLFRYWLQHKDDVTVDGVESIQGSPPPPKAKTNFIVRPTSSNEKALFREQERRRFAAPHKAFTFMMHGYDSVVGPVKGVYDKDSGANKAREHNLLVSDRPPFVTILTLVRDAAARLPNGEGTRGDICELLKDSQFLAPGVTETQINAVVSGALDRLHSEKDPCVKYDVTRKLWIYLHRNRTEDEFERIHQAQAAAVKAKKTLTRPKSGKVAKDPNLQVSPAASVVSTVTTPSKQNFTLSTLPTTTAAVVATKTTTTESAASSLLGKAPKPVTSLVRLAGNNSTSITLNSNISQIQAARAAIAKPTNTVSQIQTIKQLTSGQSLKAAMPSSTTSLAATTSVLTVTSVGLSVNSSLAAQLLYSPGLTPASLVAGKLQKANTLPTSTATTFSLVTTMNASQPVGNAPKPLAVPTISMLQNQQILKQQQAVSQSVLKQNAALVAAVGQTVAAASANSNAIGKLTPAGPKQTFTMTARQTPPPNVVVTKNQAAVTSLKPTSMKQASLILAQDGLGNLTQGTATTGGKLLALTPVPGTVSADGTVMAQIMQQAAANPGNPRGLSQSIRLHGGSLVQSVIGGKPVQISGKPFAQAKGLIQLAGKGGQPIGLIRAPQGSLSTINLIPHSAVTSALSSAPGKTATVVAVGSSSSVPSSPTPFSSPSITSAMAAPVLAAAQKGLSASSNTQAKILNPPQAGLMVTQLAQGNITLRAGGNNQTKVIPTGTASLVPTQFILHHAPGVSQASTGSLIVSNAGAGVKGGQNLQMVRTVLSQSNLKPGQATILISQPALPQGVVSSAAGLTAGQVVQASGKNSGRGSPKGKPVYARIITPPPGMKLPNMGQVPVSGGNVNMLQTVLVTSAILNPPTLAATREETVTQDKLKQDGSGDS